MSAKHLALLSAIVLDDSNRDISIREGFSTTTISLPAGTYRLRGDGASDDLCKVLVDAIEAATPSTNTYAITVTGSVDGAEPAAVVEIAVASGTEDFSLRFADGDTTFDAGLLGFPQTNTAHDADPKTSSLSPSPLWVSSQPFTSRRHRVEHAASVRRARSGLVRGTHRGGPFAMLAYDLELEHPGRTHTEEAIAAGVGSGDRATWDAFLGLVADGRAIEVHEAEASGDVLEQLTALTTIGAGWHLDEETASVFDPERREPGLARFAWRLGLLEHV